MLLLNRQVIVIVTFTSVKYLKKKFTELQV